MSYQRHNKRKRGAEEREELQRMKKVTLWLHNQLDRDHLTSSSSYVSNFPVESVGLSSETTIQNFMNTYGYDNVNAGDIQRPQRYQISLARFDSKECFCNDCSKRVIEEVNQYVQSSPLAKCSCDRCRKTLKNATVGPRDKSPIPLPYKETSAWDAKLGRTRNFPPMGMRSPKIFSVIPLPDVPHRALEVPESQYNCDNNRTTLKNTRISNINTSAIPMPDVQHRARDIKNVPPTAIPVCESNYATENLKKCCCDDCRKTFEKNLTTPRKLTAIPLPNVQHSSWDAMNVGTRNEDPIGIPLMQCNSDSYSSLEVPVFRTTSSPLNRDCRSSKNGKGPYMTSHYCARNTDLPYVQGEFKLEYMDCTLLKMRYLVPKYGLENLKSCNPI